MKRTHRFQIFLKEILAQLRYWFHQGNSREMPESNSDVLEGYTLDCTLNNLSDWRTEFKNNSERIQVWNRNSYFGNEYNTWGGKFPINLEVTKNDRTFTEHDFEDWELDQYKKDGVVTPFKLYFPYKAHKIISKKTFKYGFFRFRVTLSSAEHLWQAIWLTGANTWPPEIDGIETESYVDIHGNNKFMCSANIHYSNFMDSWIYDEDKDLAYGPIDIYDAGKEVVCDILWEKDIIAIYYNGILVHKVTDKSILSCFNQPMYIVLNNAVHYKANEPQVKCDEGETAMTVHSVQVYSKK